MNSYDLKNRLMYIIAFAVMSILPACSADVDQPLKTYQYQSNEAVFEIDIEKMEIYDDMVHITFENDSLSSVEYVNCYGKDFSIIEEKPAIEFQDNVLTIKTEKGTQISGLSVHKNSDIYFNVRYLDSDTYAILVYSFTDDLGYEVHGDADSYYTHEEKREQQALAELQAEEDAYAYNYVMGIWENKSGTIRLEFVHTKEGREYYVYEKIENQWILYQTVPVGGISGRNASDGFELELYDNPNWGTTYSFLIYDDHFKMRSDYFSDYFPGDTFTRVEE